jgi:hypothetical protein
MRTSVGCCARAAVAPITANEQRMLNARRRDFIAYLLFGGDRHQWDTSADCIAGNESLINRFLC